MPAFDLENDDSFQLTILDEYRLQDMDNGDKVEGENGDFMVLKYPDSYLLFLKSEHLIRAKKITNREFKTLDKLISYLKK